MTDHNDLLPVWRSSFAAFAVRAYYELYPAGQLDLNWHHDLIFDRLDAIERGDERRQIVLQPPRSLKSLLCSVLWPAYLLGRRPDMPIIAVSYSQPLADDLARLTMRVMKSAWYQSVFATRLSSAKQSAEQFETTDGGFRIATSIFGTLTGRGGELIIVDDAVKAEDAQSEAHRASLLHWWRNTARSRLNNQLSGSFLVVQQRLHSDDLPGMLMESGYWSVLKLKSIATEDEEHHYLKDGVPSVHRRACGEALHPERQPLSVLEELKCEMGSFTFAAQYQQEPIPAEGNIVKRSWFPFIAPHDVPPPAQIIQSWDTASKLGELNDYSVCTTWSVTASHRCHLVHVLRKRLEHPDLKRAVREQAELHRADVVLIEDKASGVGLCQDLVREGFYKCKRIVPKDSKGMRLVSVSAMIENGFVTLPIDAPWAADFLDEVTSFPGRHDDQVDSMTQALQWIRETGIEPSITTFFREEVEARERAKTRPMRIQSPSRAHHRIYLIDGRQVDTDATGCITLPANDATPLLCGGWVQILEPAA